MQKKITRDIAYKTFKEGEDFYFEHYPEYALQSLLSDAIDVMSLVLVDSGIQRKLMPKIKEAILDCLLLAPVDDPLITYEDKFEKKCRKEFRRMTPKQIAVFDKWLMEFNEG